MIYLKLNRPEAKLPAGLIYLPSSHNIYHLPHNIFANFQKVRITNIITTP